jgi:homoserine dehydrogenase
MTRTVRAALIGCGNVGRNLLRILDSKRERLRAQYGLEFQLVAVADSTGVAVDERGFDPAMLCRLKELRGSVNSFPGYLPSVAPAALLEHLDCNLLLEASPVNLQTGEPGLSTTRTALRHGIHVVLANKGPLVLAFPELTALAREHGAGLAYSATVCGALPVINIGVRDLVAADVLLLRGIFNSTSNFILGEMANGRDYGDALAEAQQRGIAETNPSLDVEGWDTANKLVIVANSFLGVAATLADVRVSGITGITPGDLARTAAAGRTLKLLATATPRTGRAGGYDLAVEPTEISRAEFLGSCDGWEMGIEIHSDLYGRMFHKIWEREPLPTAAAMLRDAVNLLV